MAITIHEVGLRDGLQIERAVVPTDVKLKWARRLAQSGVDMIQLGSFVHREKVPQMADSDELFTRLLAEGLKPVLTGLVLNEKGLERGQACGVKYFCLGVSASETHSLKNAGMTTADAQARIIKAAQVALAAGARVQVSVQSAFGCGYEGEVPRARVLDMVRRYLDAGLTVISLADTAGHATPDEVERMFAAARRLDDRVELTAHFHDTYGLGLANCAAALRAGVATFEAAFAGLGGCPFTAVTGGNVCTEDLVHMLQRMGQRTDIALEPILDVSKDAAAFFDRALPGKIYKTGPIPWRAPATA
jgi:hydroxymethylglutaryl-CoA lyase